MNDVAVARAMHLLAIIHWIGGVAFVTGVVLPSVATIAEPARRLALFEAVEQRFSAQVKVSVPVAGLSGAYMAEQFDLWGQLLTPAGWWLAAMGVVWLLFMAILFVVEPFLLRGWFHRRALADPVGTFCLVQRAHWVLLSLGLLTAGAGVLGAHGALG